MNPKIFISQRIPSKGPEMLIEKFGDNVEYNNVDGVLSKEELIKRTQGKDVLVSLLTDPIDAEFLEACPDLKLVANMAVGFNNIDINGAKERGIKATNTPGVLDETTADFAFALIMATGRRIVEADKYMRAGKFKAWEPMGFLGFDINGATLGIVGMGRIGKETARRGALGFGMKILYTDMSEVKELDFETKKVEFDELLQESDFVSLHVPLLDSTHHLIGEKELELMKETAYLINTSRGPVVHEEALYNALKENKIAGAGIDVFEKEPAWYPGLEALDNVTMVPHIASSSIQTRQKMSYLAAKNVIEWADGKEPTNWINK